MSILYWDQLGQRFFETGVDKGVLYLPNVNGAYTNGVAWNGLTSVTESPTGAEPTPMYADNVKYLNMYSVEEFSATIEAYTFPDEFSQFDGMATPTSGVTVGQQTRNKFGLSYRTRMGNDISGDELGYKLHLIYGCQASPSERAYNTVNDSPEAITFSWSIATTPVSAANLKPTSILTIDSTKVNATALGTLENFLYGTAGTDPSLPLPDAVIALFSGATTSVTPQVPAFNGTDTITIPTQTGVTYYDGLTALSSGAYTIAENTIITARPNAGYYFPAGVDDDWLYIYA
jgi:hypothetical protein